MRGMYYLSFKTGTMKKSIIPHFDLASLHGLNNLDFIADDLVICETNGKTEFQHVVDFPTRPNIFILSLCLQGSCKITIDLKEYEAVKNTITVIAPDKIIQNMGMNDDYHSFLIGISSSFYEGIFSRQNDIISLLLYFNEHPVYHLTDEETQCLLGYYHIVREKIKAFDNAFRREIIQGLITSFLYEFYDIYKKRTPSVIRPKTRKEEIFAHFIQAISENYMQERTVAVYAEKLYLTPKHLSGVVKEVSGKTPGEWIDERVILEAKALLKSSEMSIQQISETLHFTNQSFFGKYFRHYVGMSPKEYRRS